MAEIFNDGFWTDEIFWPWLAGYFERGGRIRLPPETLTVYLSLWGKNEAVLHAIQQRVHAGEVQPRLTATPTFVWRVQRQPEVERVLTSMLPFLTVGREAAYQSLDRFNRRRHIRQAREIRNREILIAWELGNHSQAAIAARLNTTTSVVAQVIARNRTAQGITLRRPRTRIR